MYSKTNREQRWKFTYAFINKDGDRVVKSCYPRSEEKKSENIKKCKEQGMEIVSITKLYPFSTMKNQHNFDLIHNIVMNELYEYYDGKKLTEEEVERLEWLRDKSEKYFSLELPVAWLPWEEWKEAHELSQMAILHRQEACIANGRPDLVTYC